MPIALNEDRPEFHVAVAFNDNATARELCDVYADLHDLGAAPLSRSAYMMDHRKLAPVISSNGWPDGQVSFIFFAVAKNHVSLMQADVVFYNLFRSHDCVAAIQTGCLRNSGDERQVAMEVSHVKLFRKLKAGGTNAQP